MEYKKLAFLLALELDSPGFTLSVFGLVLARHNLVLKSFIIAIQENEVIILYSCVFSSFFLLYKMKYLNKRFESLFGVIQTTLKNMSRSNGVKFFVFV